MNKSELIDAMAIDAGISKAAAKVALESFMANVTTTLQKGGKVSLMGWGKWTVSKRAARTGNNPKTGKKINIARRKVVKFKTGLGLNRAVN